MNKGQAILINDWWEKLRPLVHKFSRESIIQGLERDDLIQECYLLLREALEKFDEHYGVPFESYYKIYLYGWRSNQNKKKRAALIAAYENDYLMVDERIDIEKSVEEHILYLQVIEKMESLKEIERRILIEYYIKERKLTEIAAAYGLSYKCVVKRKGEGIYKLKQIFAQ